MARVGKRAGRGNAGTMLSILRERDYRTLWAADMISLLGDWAGRLALTVLVLDRTGSPAWAAAVTAVSLAGFVGLGQVLATLADRFGRVTVMLVSDLARAALFAALLIHMPVGMMLLLAFLAGLATPPFEAARSAALVDLVPEERYGDALALAGITVQGAIVAGNALGGLLLVLVGPRGALAVNAASFLVSGLLVFSLRHSAAATPGGTFNSVGGSLRQGAANLFGDRMVRRAMGIVATTGALGTVAEALLVPYARDAGTSRGLVGILAGSVAVGTVIGSVMVKRSSSHEQLLRNAGICTMITAGLAAPLFWLEVSGFGAFVAFAITGGMFAVSIPTNIVVGTRLLRATRASAMGIAVGVLMGSQALGAAVGGVVASAVGPAQAIAGALTAAAFFGAWTTLTTPVDPKHLVGRRHILGESAPARATTVIDLDEPNDVVDLAAFEAEAHSSHDRIRASVG